MALVDIARAENILGSSLGGAGGGPLEVRDESDIVSDPDVGVIRFPDGTVTINAAGDVSIDPAAGSGFTPFVNGAVFASDSNTAALGIKALYACTDTTAPRTLTIQSASIALGAPGTPWFFTVKDQSGGAGPNRITIETEGAETIDGAPSIQITENFGAAHLYSDGTNLFSR